jgi:competence/damage-inducible protein CinA-like protein
MPVAEIITIGTEILLGEIIDTNARYLARQLRENGIDVFRTSSIGDNADRIAEAIQHAQTRAEVIITTGGLGPTIDDPTREAVAQAFATQVEFREELWQQVINRFARFDRTPTENNKRQAYVPQGSIAIENEVGTAPAFLMDSKKGVVISLPGVPREMEHIFQDKVLPFLRQKYVLDSVLIVRVLKTAGTGESSIDEKIADLEESANPTVGLAAHSGQVDIRLAAKAATETDARAIIEPMEQEIRNRLGSLIFGADEETLESIALDKIAARGWQLVALEAGLNGKLVGQLAASTNGDGTFQRGEVLPHPPANPEDLMKTLKEYHQAHGTTVALGVAIYPPENRTTSIYLALLTPEDEKFLRVPYGGPAKLAGVRAINYGLDLLRKVD